MKDLRIVFMGTPEFAVTILAKMAAEEYPIVGVVTAPDRPAGRGRKLKASAVKEYAETQGIPVLQPTNLKSEEFNTALKALQPNVQVVVAFRMLPKVVWNLPEFGTFNLHASLLPQYRGAAPINWAIMNGEKESGVTTFFLDEKIDTGKMILQEKVAIEEEDTAEDLHDKLMYSGAQLVIKTLAQIAHGNVVTTLQEESETFKEAPKLTPENTKINWKQHTKSIINHVRGLSPYPAAWCFLHHGEEKLRCKIRRASVEETENDHAIGSVYIADKKIKVVTSDAVICIEEIQLPGKRNMEIRELLNGFQLKENAYMS